MPRDEFLAGVRAGLRASGVVIAADHDLGELIGALLADQVIRNGDIAAALVADTAQQH